MTPAEHAKAIERAVEIYSRDFAIYCDTQALTDFRVCSVSLATLQAAIQAGVGAAANAAAPAQAQAVAVPLTDEWIRSRCKESWIFDTVKQWVRMTEAAHGIAAQQGDKT